MLVPSKVDAFFDFMKEREGIRLRKESGAPRPWTVDPILQEYKFTNVFRFHDWTTTQLRENFYEPHRDDDRRAILMNCALFRYFGTYEFAEAVGWQRYDMFPFGDIEWTATERLMRKERVFTGAYVITNQGISAPKEYVVTQHFLRDLHAAVPDLLLTVQKTRSWRQLSRQMSTIKGFGGTGFMVKEILLDTMMTDFWSEPNDKGIFFDGYSMSRPKDYYSWTPVGPGARRGLNRLLGHDVPDQGRKLKEDQMLYHILELSNMGRGPGVLTPTDIQFQLCEFDKYERVRLGQGRPRSKYTPRSEQ